MFPKQVKIVEVGPRDGLQNEAQQVTTDVKLAFIAKLAASGLRTIEATAFVSPKWVPQMADHAAVLSALDTAGDVDYPVLVPNLKGLENAITCGAKRVAILLAASETFSKKNTNVSIAQSVANARAIHQAATDAGISVRAYISCVMGCPYEGAIDPAVVVDLTEQALAMGCDEVSLGDTIGVGTPNQMTDLLQRLTPHIPQLAVHCHNTYGQALANIYVALSHGVAVIDSACAGLGGCPYARGASGNIATEEVVYLCHGLGITTGVDLDKLIAAGDYICAQIQRDNQSLVAKAIGSKCQSS